MHRRKSRGGLLQPVGRSIGILGGGVGRSCGEAEEVQSKNPCLDYSFPLHQIREIGSLERLLDLLDERSLSKSEIGGFCRFLFREDSFDGFPEASVDWKKFVFKVHETLLPRERLQWNPIKKRAVPWIDLRDIERTSGPEGVIAFVVVAIIAVLLHIIS